MATEHEVELVVRTFLDLEDGHGASSRARLASMNSFKSVSAVAWALPAAADVDVSQAAVIDQRPQMIDRNTEPLRCFFEIEQFHNAS
jgi:hypothetical protein